MKHLGYAFLLSSCAISAMLPGAAVAQSTAAQGSYDAQGDTPLGDIIVTARKRAETSIAVPVVLTAFSGAELRARAITSLDVVARLTPGVVLGEGGVTAQGGNLVIRGIQGADTNILGDQAVSFNIDGVQIAKAAVRRMAQMDIEQVEVLKGPQALFFGKNAPGGIISVRTADPTDSLTARVSAGYEFGAREFRGEGYISGPLTDTLGARVAFFGSDMRGWVKSQIPEAAAMQPVSSRGPRSTEYAGRLTLKFESSDAFNARLKVTYGHTSGDPSTYATQMISCPRGAPTSVTGIALVDDCTANDTSSVASSPVSASVLSPLYAPTDDMSQSQFLASLEMNYNPNPDVTITSVSGYYSSKYDATFLSSASYEFTSLLANAQYFRNKEFTQEIRVTTDYGGPINATLGGFFQDVDGRSGNASILAGRSVAGGPFDIVVPFNAASFFYHQKTRAYSAFGQVRWTMLEHLELSAGGRYSYETKRLPLPDGVITGLPGSVPAIVQTRKVTFDDFSPEITLSYRPTSRLTMFGSYKRGFLSGGFNTGAAGTTNFTYNPEVVKGFEAGVKALLLDDTLRMNLAAFTYEASGIQLSVTVNNGIVALRNAAGARIKGLEWDMNYKTPVPGLGLSAGVAYTHGRYTDYTASCYAGQSLQAGCVRDPALNAFTQNLNGSQLLRSPDWQGNVGFTYDTPVGPDLKLGVNGDMSFSSSYFTDAPNDPAGRMGSYQLFNATVRLSEAKDRWSLALIGRNLGNKYYWVRSADRSFTSANTGGSLVDPNPALRPRLADKLGNVSRGREVMLQATSTF